MSVRADDLAEELYQSTLKEDKLNSVELSVSMAIHLSETTCIEDFIFQITTSVPLEGYELIQYEQEQAERNRVERSVSPISSDSSDSETEHEPVAKDVTGLFDFSNDVYVWEEIQEELIGFQRNRRAKLFPFVEKKWKEDEYGEILGVNEFRIEGQEGDADKRRNEEIIREMVGQADSILCTGNSCYLLVEP